MDPNTLNFLLSFASSVAATATTTADAAHATAAASAQGHMHDIFVLIDALDELREGASRNQLLNHKRERAISVFSDSDLDSRCTAIRGGLVIDDEGHRRHGEIRR